MIFKNVPGCGDLELDQVLVEYTYILLSVLKDKLNHKYLCMCFDTRGAQQWLITEISEDMLTALLNNKIPLIEPFKNPDTRKILAVLDYQTQKESFQELKASEIPSEYLPADGEYLD